MEQLSSVLTSYPPASASSTSHKQQDELARVYLSAIAKLSASNKRLILEQPEAFLKLLDPAKNSIGYLFVLNTILNASEPRIGRPSLLDAIVVFLLSFDPIQVRYVGNYLLPLLEAVGTGKLFPPQVAVEILATAMLRLDSNASMFTSTHLLLATYAYETDCVEPALKVLERDITTYPIAAQKEQRFLCDPELPLTSFISVQTGLTAPVKATTVLEYDFIRGLIYMSRREWTKARKALERVIAYPTKDKGVSKIMIDAHKKWLLVGLLSDGEAPQFPGYTSAAAKSAYNIMASGYREVASTFSSPKAIDFVNEVISNRPIWLEDGNVSLIQEVQVAYQKWQILNLRRIYREVSIYKIQESTSSGETGEPLANPQQVISLVQSMIDSKALKGEITVGPDSESFLTFQGEQEWSSEKDFAGEIAQAHHNINLLSQEYKASNERLSGHRDYVRFMIRELKRADKDDSDAGGFDAQIEDEDLMNDIVHHG
ncbi:unnamed protein product [Clonostachys chloroleuca]|uniref:COP9 signalosome complex subunit 3 N-terminal helical repeats domain-containing protein n=1 Tax=Clonostachys chloroleuca TaxID=1926264 RepID=A0AA35QDZ2_9HYPO|nr:unnamed protein product [Clonostachys chloroleuca]